MKTDKKSLIEYDFNLYTKKYNELKKGIKENKNVDGLNQSSMKAWLKKGIFARRLKFRNTEENFYITTASINRGHKGGRSSNPDYMFEKDYLIPYWMPSKKGEALMEFEIGSESPINGVVDLIADFEPFEDNLLKSTYRTISENIFVENAKQYLNGEDIDYEKGRKIDISNFFRLKFELASQGAQAKALYDTSNCIIDGSAGTGKSTIAIQKLKYFSENNLIDQDKLLVIVKNEYLKSHFLTLLKDDEINLPDIRIDTLNNIFDTTIVEKIEDLTEEANNLKKELIQLIKKQDIESLNIHYTNLFNFLGVDFFREKITMLLKNLQNELNLNKILILNDEVIELEESIKKESNLQNSYKTKRIQIEQQSNLQQKFYSQKEIQKELKFIDTKLFECTASIQNIKKRIKKKKENVNKLRGEHYKNILNKLDNSTTLSISILKNLEDLLYHDKYIRHISVLKWILEYKKFLEYHHKYKKEKKSCKDRLNKEELSKMAKKELQQKINTLEQKLNEEFKYKDSNFTKKFNQIMEQIYFSKQHIKKKISDNRYSEIIYKILNISEKEFDTIIVDEAQDFSKFELELARLHTKRIVLTGDILQNVESNNGVKNWDEIFNIKFLQNAEGKLNIHNLKRNFRQTYPLATMSYNYRQLLLNKKIEDISSYYFENEKIFNAKEYPKPTLRHIEYDSALIQYIENKIIHITETYSERFPLYIIYKNIEEKEFYKNLLRDYIISTKIDNSADIVLLNLNEIKGNEFPIVFSNINSFTKKELYLIMTRAQFELDFFIKSYENFNPIIYNLIHNKENISFLKLFDIDVNRINQPTKNMAEKKNEDKIIQQSIFKDVAEKNQIKQTTKNNILKHKSESMQWEDDINSHVIQDEKKYENDFIKQIQKDTNNLNNEDKNKIIKQITIVKKDSKVSREQKEKIKIFLYNTYKGYCQICGFTFRKEKDNKNYFELFNWNDKRIVKIKKDFISTADSLCLCRNCSANLKWGSFDPIFINHIDKINNFKNQNIYNIIEKLHNVIDKNIPKKFQADIDFSDLYALEIKLNQQSKNIYFTNEHLVQFIAYLKLEVKEIYNS